MSITIKEQKMCLILALKRDAFTIEKLAKICEAQQKTGSLKEVKESLIADIRRDRMPVMDMLEMFDSVPETVLEEVIGMLTKAPVPTKSARDPNARTPISHEMAKPSPDKMAPKK